MKKEKSFKVTPWEIQGEIDYKKLIRQFGVSKIESPLLERIKKHAGDIHFLLRRGVYFSHRDLSWILDEYEKGNKFFLYTGRGPSENMHFGHLLPFLITKWIQEKFRANLYIQLTDDEKFLFKPSLDLQEATKIAYENMLDIIAMGFNPESTKILIDTQHVKTLYPLALKVAKKLNFSTAKAVFGFTNESNVGQIFYTSMQSAPCFLEKRPCLIPLGIDQDPHFRVTRDIAPKLNFYKPSLLHGMMLPSLKGPEGKMSASDPNSAVYTTDAPETVEKKIKKYAFSGGQDTLEAHRKKGANLAVDVCFQYLRMFFEPDDKKLQEIAQAYSSGKMLTSEIKEITIEKINSFLKEHQKKRAQAKSQIDKFLFKE